MSENNDIPEVEPVETPRRGKGSTKKRVRRQFAAELQDLQSRVDMALRLLRRFNGQDGSDPLVSVAIETLQGD